MWDFLVKLIIEGLKALLGALKPTMEDGAKKGDLEVRLREKAKKDGWK
jgi:hypothetical protein